MVSLFALNANVEPSHNKSAYISVSAEMNPIFSYCDVNASSETASITTLLIV